MSLTSLPINQALFLAGLEQPNKMRMVYSRDNDYNVLTQLASMLGPSISTSNPKVEIASLGDLSVYSTVTATSSLSGTDLVVSLASTNGFRLTDVVLDTTTLVQGRVKAVTATTITLSEMGTAFATGTHFKAGYTARVSHDASKNYDSVGKSTLRYLPDTEYTYTAVSRESGSQSRRERTASYVDWNNGYWHSSWIDLVAKKYAKQLEFKYAFSERGAYNVGTSDEYYQTQGLRSSILDRGKYMSLSSEMTLDDFNDFIREMRRVVANGRKMVALMGIEALGRLQMLCGNQYLTYTGTANTFGGVSVEGLEIYKYNYVGMSLEFVHWTLLDDPSFLNTISTVTGKPKHSSSIYFLDMTPLPAADGSGMINPIQKYHFNDDELIAGFIPGMIGLTGSTPSAVKETIANFAPGSLSVSDQDNVSFHILSDDGLAFHADRFGLIELAS